MHYSETLFESHYFTMNLLLARDIEKNTLVVWQLEGMGKWMQIL
jgi:hypothetical protein